MRLTPLLGWDVRFANPDREAEALECTLNRKCGIDDNAGDMLLWSDFVRLSNRHRQHPRRRISTPSVAESILALFGYRQLVRFASSS
jgi:hypothetical protein